MALEFDGADQYFTSAIVKTDFAQVSFLFKGTKAVVAHWTGDYVFTFIYFEVSGSNIYCRYFTRNTAGNYRYYGCTLDDITYDTSTVYLLTLNLADKKVYRDGIYIEDALILLSSGAACDWNTIGGTITFQAYMSNEVVEYSAATVVEYLVYDQVLSEAELRSIYHARGLANIVHDLKGRWLMNEKSDGGTATVASSIIDISGNGKHGTPTNAPVYRAEAVRLVRLFQVTRVAETYTETLTKKLGFVQSFVLGPFGLSLSLNLGFVPSHSSIIDGLKTLKLGLVPSQISVVYGFLEKKLGFVPDHTSVIYGELAKKLGFVPSYVLGPLGLLHVLKLGFVPDHTSIVTGILTKKLGFVPESTSTKITELLKRLGFVPSLTSVVYGVKTLKLGFVPDYTSIVSGILIKKLGFVPSHTSITYGFLTKKFGLVPDYTSVVYGVLTKKLGLVPAHTSIVYGILTKKLGFVTIHVSAISKFIVELRFYDRDDNLVKIISSKAQNFPLVDPGLEFTLLRDGGCGSFKFTTSEDIGVERGYRLDLYLYESLWYSGRLERVPEPGLSTSRTYKYSGFGFLSELNWKLIEEGYTNVELSAIVTDILEKYYYSKSDILEE